MLSEWVGASFSDWVLHILLRFVLIRTPRDAVETENYLYHVAQENK